MKIFQALISVILIMSAQYVVARETVSFFMIYDPFRSYAQGENNAQFCKKITGEAFHSFNSIKFEIDMRNVKSST